MQVWIPDWVTQHIPIRNGVTDPSDKSHQLRKNFYWWLDWWDSSQPRTGTYEDTILETCLEYAKQDLFNNKIRS